MVYPRHPQSADINQAYIENPTLKVHDIALAFGVRDSLVYSVLKRFGTPLRLDPRTGRSGALKGREPGTGYRVPREQWPEVCRLYADCRVSIGAIAKQFNCYKTTIIRIAKMSGVPLRRATNHDALLRGMERAIYAKTRR